MDRYRDHDSHRQTHVHVYIYIYVCTCTCIYNVYIYTCKCTCICIYVHTRTCTYTVHVQRDRQRHTVTNNYSLLHIIPCLTRPNMTLVHASHLVGESNDRTTSSWRLSRPLVGYKWGTIQIKIQNVFYSLYMYMYINILVMHW